MFYRNKKTRKYQAPAAFETHMALESNFCQTVRFLIDVEDLENVNALSEEERAGEYFDPIVL
jgi:hypothetical protein